MLALPIRALSAAALLVAAATLSAQPYPAKQPVKIVVPYAAGSTIDTVGRFMAEELHKALGGTFVVENRAGAVGLIGTEFVAKAPADGYTLVVSSGATHSAAPWMFKNPRYRAVEDFTHIGRWLQQAYLVVVPPQSPAKSLAEFLALARNNPGKLNFGYGSTSAQLGATGLMTAAAFQAVGVGYKSQPPAVTDLLAGRLDFMVLDTAAAAPRVRTGSLRALAVTSLQRSSFIAEVPTVAESGFPGFDYSTWMGLAGPAGMPPEIVERINGETARLLARPDTRGRFLALGLEVVPNTISDHQQFVKQELQAWRKRVSDARIEPE